jgi:hypothetical protein
MSDFLLITKSPIDIEVALTGKVSSFVEPVLGCPCDCGDLAFEYIV